MNDHVLASLETCGVVNVQYPPLLRPKIQAVVSAWSDFCALPDELKRRFPYVEDHLVSGAGYQPPQPGADPKEHFHVRLEDALWLTIEASKLGDSTVTAYVHSALDLIEGMRIFIEDFARVAEREFGIAGLANDVAGSMDKHLLRCLRYLPGAAPGAVIAEPHVDKGGFTPHLYESTRGLQYLTYEGTWKDISFTEQETAIIPGFRSQYRSECLLKATCHRVVASEEAAARGRESMVIFCDFPNTPYYDKKRWGRMQNFPQGFFYDVPFLEFQKYFTHG